MLIDASRAMAGLADSNMDSVSKEQKEYITYSKTDSDTKLLATAGSGKTFCIIQHLLFLVQSNLYKPSEIIVLTFSKNARDDFICKLRKSKAAEIVKRNVFTIDSFAWRLLGEQAYEIDVSILSYTMMLELENSSKEDLFSRYPSLSAYTCVFVDEAQDLNETQYRLLLALKEKTGATLHLVGDPNQNIFQFRRSSDKYLIKHPAKTFNLTCNYRSNGHIVDFCSFLRPYNVCNTTFSRPLAANPLDILFYSYHDSISFENYLLSVIYMFKAKKIPLHKCAILAPTRGYLKDMNGMCKYKGLCYIANLLYKHDVAFQQFYNDSGPGAEDQDSVKLKYKPLKDHVNLMTYTASKGLEWDYVIIIDANAHLISKKDYSPDKFNQEKYLLYVACSRPRKNLIIFTKSKYTNPWFKEIPEDKYKVSRICKDSFDFFDASKLFEKSPNMIDMNMVSQANISTIVKNLTEEKLYQLNSMLRGKVSNSEVINYINNTDVSKNLGDCPEQRKEKGWVLLFPENKRQLVAKFLEHMFYVHMTGTAQHESSIMVDVQNAITCVNIVPCHSEHIIYWYFTNRAAMTWQLYDLTKKDIHGKIVQFIDSKFDRNVLFNSYTLVDKYYDAFISTNRAKIEDAYNAYINDPFEESNVFFITLTSYAIQSTHYFYIQQHDAIKSQIIGKNETMSTLHALNNMCASKDAKSASDLFTIKTVNPIVNNMQCFGKADFTCTYKSTGTDYFCKIKFAQSVTLKDIVYMCMLNLLTDETPTPTPTPAQTPKDLTFLVANLYKGHISEYCVQLTHDDCVKMKSLMVAENTPSETEPSVDK
jgi:hypothetical protein